MLPNPRHNILCIIGPTATGKTALAVELSRHIPSVLISADSRQVYREMDVVTGKDHPSNLPMFGLDLASPNEDFSVSNWYQSIVPHLKDALASHKLPIVVGGTGLYIKALAGDIKTVNIPINQELRKNIEHLSVKELQKNLQDCDLSHFQRMNNSDLHNPRRLVRAIEVAKYQQHTNTLPLALDNFSIKIIGLVDHDNAHYQQQIALRVAERINNGAIEETQNILTKYGRSYPAITAIGYRSITNYLDRVSTLEEMKETWAKDEVSYAKRQLLFFRTLKDVVWYDAGSPDLLSQVVKDVNSWYDNN